MSIARSSLPNDGRVARFATRALVVGAVIGITMLGNLRSQASEIGGPVAGHPVQTPRPHRAGVAVAEAKPAASPGEGANRSDVDEQELRLVPAIYAWDRDVRFVYFRHVSKWM